MLSSLSLRTLYDLLLCGLTVVVIESLVFGLLQLVFFLQAFWQRQMNLTILFKKSLFPYPTCSFLRNISVYPTKFCETQDALSFKGLPTKCLSVRSEVTLALHVSFIITCMRLISSLSLLFQAFRDSNFLHYFSCDFICL